MFNDVITALEIDHTRKQLECIVQQYEYDFNHPDVIAISQRLDRLILKVMTKQEAIKYN
ncbi:MAG: aspartyl-phosphate phosphatase Spo0E family protein [Paenibacillaceae bacterium]